MEKELEKISYYRELCKMIVVLDDKQALHNIDTINKVIFSTKLTESNLTNHKQVIRDLIKINSDKRNEIYALNTEKQILEKEINFWVYEYHTIRYNPSYREQLEKLNLDQIKKNLDIEFSHKKQIYNKV
jgi:RNA polymerase-interacting CarD/CdnL/TRCF family regulator